MKDKKIKPLPFVKKFYDYFVGRGKKVLGLKKPEYVKVSFDFAGSGKIWVWFYGHKGIIARAEFFQDGRFFSKTDNRLEEGVTLKEDK